MWLKQHSPLGCWCSLSLFAWHLSLLRPLHVGLDHDSWGIDHGTCSILGHVFPQADIPVMQLSIHAAAPLDYHMDIAARLAPFRERGIFILASGNVVHNLRRIDWARRKHGFDRAERFDAHVREVRTTRPASLAEVQGHPNYSMALPTQEHFLPLAYLAGFAPQRARQRNPSHRAARWAH